MSNWSAVKAIEKDKVHVFKQTGIFVLACWHGFIEYIAKMKCSSELYVITSCTYLSSQLMYIHCSTKYDLAAINQILEFCDNDHAIGHDIGCASGITVSKSALSGQAKEAGLRIVVVTDAWDPLPFSPIPSSPLFHFLWDMITNDEGISLEIWDQFIGGDVPSIAF